MKRYSLDNYNKCAYNPNRFCINIEKGENLPNETNDITNEPAQLRSLDLSQTDINRLRIFFGSRFNEPLICLCHVSVFISYDLHISNYSITDCNNSNNWKSKAQGAILLQINYDKELPQEVCGARLIVANSQTCDMLWSTKLYSRNKYRCINENFHVFSKLSKNSIVEEETILRDYAVGIYFTNSKAAQQYYEFVVDYFERVAVHEKRDFLSRKEAIQNLKQTKRSKKKSETLRKSMISAPVMFAHTFHIEK